MKPIKYLTKQGAEKVYLQFGKSIKSEKGQKRKLVYENGGRPITNG